MSYSWLYKVSILYCAFSCFSTISLKALQALFQETHVENNKRWRLFSFKSCIQYISFRYRPLSFLSVSLKFHLTCKFHQYCWQVVLYVENVIRFIHPCVLTERFSNQCNKCHHIKLQLFTNKSFGLQKCFQNAFYLWCQSQVIRCRLVKTNPWKFKKTLLFDYQQVRTIPHLVYIDQ